MQVKDKIEEFLQEYKHIYNFNLYLLIVTIEHNKT